MKDWSREPLGNRCDMCAERRADVLRFGLVRRTRQPDGRQTSRGAGGIWLCRRCWQGLGRLRQHETERLRALG